MLASRRPVAMEIKQTPNFSLSFLLMGDSPQRASRTTTREDFVYMQPTNRHEKHEHLKSNYEHTRWYNVKENTCWSACSLACA